jgi:uncharacterized protein YciI
VADYFLVRIAEGPSWDPTRGLREQAGWDEHAAFMDTLAEEGVIVLGGPVEKGDGHCVLLVADVESEGEIRSHLANDPWHERVLTIASVSPWSVWLRAPAQP